MIRVGLGQDSHTFSEDKNKKLVLGGVEVTGCQGLEGNSDGDAVIHALCNALEQAIGGNSFHSYSGKMCKEGISDSVEYLKVAVKHVAEASFLINNIGINIEAQKPKIDPVANNIRTKLAGITSIDRDQIGITATTGENLTSFGKGRGIQVFVIVSLLKK